MSETKGLIVPAVHLNGTSREHLLEQYADAYHALANAIELVAQTAPNGRDYYVQGDTVIRDATSQHQTRMDRLRSVRGELDIIRRAIMSGAEGRA